MVYIPFSPLSPNYTTPWRDEEKKVCCALLLIHLVKPESNAATAHSSLYTHKHKKVLASSLRSHWYEGKKALFDRNNIRHHGGGGGRQVAVQLGEEEEDGGQVFWRPSHTDINHASALPRK